VNKQEQIKFVGLHAHSVAGSPFDGLGYPQEHMDFAYENGSDALALTDHGNMNGLAYQVLHAKKMEAEGRDFKPIYGVEAYFIPSISDWRETYDRVMEDKKAARAAAKGQQAGATVENEDASKKSIKNLLNRRRHLILLAQNETGLKNIFKLVSESYQPENFYRYPRVDFELLAKHSEGVIAASACLGGVYAGNFWENGIYDDEGNRTGVDEPAALEAMRETTRRMVDIFGDRWFAELQWNSIPEQHQLNQLIIKVAAEFGVELISTADSHYPHPEAWKDRELYKRLAWLGRGMPSWASEEGGFQLPASVDEIGYELYPKNGDQMWSAYQKYSSLLGEEYDDEMVKASISRTHDIAHNRIERFYPDNTVRLPDFVVPAGMTATQALIKICAEGMKSFGLMDDEEYMERLKLELGVIDDRGFSKYFLTMKAIADRASGSMLAGPGRGSAAGSLVAYVLGITQIDPIKYGLLFSRFLRSDATDYPDIDYDVADPMALKEQLIEEWGEDTVAPISNWNTLQLRSLIKDISKLYGIPFTEVNEVTGKMLHEATGPAKKRHGIKAGVYAPTFEEVMEFSVTLRKFLDKYPHVKTHVNALYGQTRSCSRHAGGVVVAEKLDSYMPLINSGGVRQTPWSEGQNVRHLEPMGFIKFDILGLASLRMIDGAVRHILKRHHGIKEPTFADVKDYYDRHLHPDTIDFSDQQVYKNIFHAGKWAGVFQFTETGAQKFCVRAKPTSIIDISAITSIFRPGPLSAGVDKDYVEAKNSPQYVKYIHPIVQEVTEETFGFLIFQEQIAILAHKLGKDLTLDEGNLLRKLLTKKGTGKHDKKTAIYNKFMQGCEEKGIQKSDGQRLWDTFEYFSGYGFNKSHAVSYSVLSFQCAWLLNYYPAEWMAAFLDKEPEKRKEKAIAVAKQWDFEIRPIDVNTSGRVWEISEDGKTLIQPLSSIKGLGDAAIAQIMFGRPFNNVEEFLFNPAMVYSKLNKRALDVLVRSGALSCLMDDRFTGAKHFWSAVAVDRPRKEKNLEENIELYAPEGEFTEEEIIQFKVDLTGAFPMDMIMDEHLRGRLDELAVPPISKFDPDLHIAWFIPRQVTTRKTKNGKDYWILEVIDDSNSITKIKCWGIRPKRDKLFLNRPYMAKLDYSEQWGLSTRSVYHSFRMLA
jgi:DNA polymerase-3 subunit alpha